MAITDFAASGSARLDWQCPTCRIAARARAGLVSLPNNPLIVAAVQALCAGGSQASSLEGGWRRDKDGEPLYEFWSGSGGRIFVTVDASAEQAWAEIESYSSLSLDCALAVLACLTGDAFRSQTAAPRRGEVWLGAPAVLNLKGYKRFGGEREAFAQTVESELRKLMRLRFELVDYPAFDPELRKWNAAGISRAGLGLFERCEQAGEPDDGDCSRGAPLRFGAWSEHWLHGGGAMWVSSMPEALLRLDHRDNRGPEAMAKKIAILLALNWGAARRKKEICIEVRTLLRRIGELHRPGADATIPTGRLADRLEEALLRLTELGVQHSESRTDHAMDLRAASRKWRDDWLDSIIVFERPDYFQRGEFVPMSL